LGASSPFGGQSSGDKGAEGDGRVMKGEHGQKDSKGERP